MKRTKKKPVLVLDRATNHTFLHEEDKRPATSWNKARLVDSIARWERISDEWPLTWRLKKKRNELLEQAREIYPMHTYNIQKIAIKFDGGEFQIKILFLPLAQPELNLIEMVWSKIKRGVATKNSNFRLSAVQEMTKQVMLKFTASEFTKYVEHVKLQELKCVQINS